MPRRRTLSISYRGLPVARPRRHRSRTRSLSAARRAREGSPATGVSASAPLHWTALFKKHAPPLATAPPAVSKRVRLWHPEWKDPILYSSPLPMDHDVRRHGFSSVASHLRQCQSSCPHKVCDDQPTSSIVAAALLATVRLTVAREFADSALFQRAVVKPVLAPAMLLSSHALGRIIQAFVAIAYADAVTGLAPVRQSNAGLWPFRIRLWRLRGSPGHLQLRVQLTGSFWWILTSTLAAPLRSVLDVLIVWAFVMPPSGKTCFPPRCGACTCGVGSSTWLHSYCRPDMSRVHGVRVSRVACYRCRFVYDAGSHVLREWDGCGTSGRQASTSPCRRP